MGWSRRTAAVAGSVRLDAIRRPGPQCPEAALAAAVRTGPRRAGSVVSRSERLSGATCHSRQLVPHRSGALTTRRVGSNPPFHRFEAQSQQLLVWARRTGGEEVYHTMMEFISHLRSREEGQALVEYALILSLIAVVCIGALTLLGGNVNNILNQIAGAL
jgi:pilus assembly protein Flp/PilA